MADRKTVDQTLYDAVFLCVQESGADGYDTLPGEGAAYPFFVVGGVEIIPIPTKSWLLGKGYVRVDLWADGTNRAKASAMLQEVVTRCSQKSADDTIWQGYHVALSLAETTTELRMDNSTEDDLWHGIATLVFFVS